MLKIVLIDDEMIVLRGIAALIRKQAEYELAGTADNGIDGLKVVLETEPDIVMTDIRMPGMSGLEMIKRIKKSLPNTVYIVFSGFNEFKYVKEAIGLGVVDYIEKPVTIPKLKEVLKKASGILRYQENYQEMTKNRQKADRAIIEKHLRDLHERLQDQKDILEQIREKNPNLTGCHSVFVVKAAEEQGESVEEYRNMVQRLTFEMIGQEPVEVYSFYERGNLILVYFNLGGMEFPFLEKVRDQKRRIDQDGVQVMIGTSCVHRGISELGKAFEEADNAFRYARYLGETDVISSDEVEFSEGAEVPLRKEYDALVFEFRSGQYEECRAHAKACIARLRSGDLRPEVYVQSCCELLYRLQIILNEAERSESRYLNIDFYELMEMKVEEQITAWTEEKIDRIMDEAQSRQNDGTSRTIREMKSYIDRHYAEGISLDELADQVHMSKTYLSMLFKKEEGISYIKYLTKVRMEKAMEFLKQGYKAKVVCEMVGYHDYKYFSAQFKNSTGMTLDNYKKSL